MASKTTFSLLNLVCVVFVLFGFAGNCAVAAVFADHISTGGQDSEGTNLHGTDKEPVPEYLQSVVSCKLGQPHRQYPECRCGERVEIVPEEEIPFEVLGDFHVRVKQTHRGKRREIFYHCLFCSQCPDGVRTQSNCSRMADTQCTTSCIKPTDIFDNGRKACVPDPRFVEEETTESVGQTDTIDILAARAEEKGTGRPMPMHLADNPALNEKPESLYKEAYLLIGVGALVVIVVIVLTISNVVICKTYLHHRTMRDQEKQRILPKTTSTGSMTTTSWTSTASITEV